MCWDILGDSDQHARVSALRAHQHTHINTQTRTDTHKHKHTQTHIHKHTQVLVGDSDQHVRASVAKVLMPLSEIIGKEQFVCLSVRLCVCLCACVLRAWG